MDVHHRFHRTARGVWWVAIGLAMPLGAAEYHVDAAKGDDARFRKTERGKFALAR